MEKFLNVISDIALILAIVFIIVGVVSRLTITPWPFGIEAQAHLQFAQFLLLFAIALGIRKIARK